LAREIGDGGHTAGMICLGFGIDPRQRLNSVVLEKRDVSLGLFLGIADDAASNLNVVGEGRKSDENSEQPKQNSQYRATQTEFSV